MRPRTRPERSALPVSQAQIADALFWCVGVPGILLLIAIGWLRYCDSRKMR